MRGLPEITVIGTLTADPDLRHTATGTPVANFSVAANERRRDPNTGEWVDGDATFLRCSVWREVAENVSQSLRRGMRVFVTGSLRQRSFETAEGERRSTFEVDVTEVGPSLRWATATVQKATRNGTSAPAGEPAADATGPARDPDEPPF